MKTKYPVHIMAFGVVTSDGDVMPPSIFLHDPIPNIKFCIKFLKEIVLP